MDPFFQRNIQYFLKAAKAGSFALAAKQLAVTQSSITIAIKNLESELGAPLFDRSVRGVRLTEKGQRVFELLNQQQKLISEKLMEALGRETEVIPRIGCRATYLTSALLPAMKAVGLENQRIFCRASPILTQAVTDGRLDFAFIGSAHQPSHRLEFVKVQKAFVGYVGLKSHFSHLKNVRTVSELNDSPLIVAKRETQANWSTQLDHANRGGFLVNEIAVIKQLVMLGQGIAKVEMDWFTPEEQKKLIQFKASKPEPQAGVYAIYRQQLPAHAKKWLDRLIEQLKN